MPMLLLVLLFVFSSQEAWTRSPFEWNARESCFVVMAGATALILAAAGFAVLFQRALWIAPDNRVRILRRFHRARLVHFIAATIFFAVALYFLGWGWAVQQSLSAPWSAFAKLLTLAPYFAALITSWAFFYDVDRTAHHFVWFPEQRPYPPRSTYLELHVRHNLLLVAPPLVMMTLLDLIRSFLPTPVEGEAPALQIALFFGMLLLALSGLPIFLRVFLGLKPLPPGELRDRLTGVARRLGFRYSDILVWNTQGTQINAMVSGMLPFLRYIVVTDRLLRELSQDEVEAVFGHEIGHIKHHHLAFYTIFLLLSLAALGVCHQPILLWIDGRLPEWIAFIAPVLRSQELFVGFVLVYLFLAFGFLSRSCERQADLFGCQVASRESFIRALEKVADINGISKEKPGWFSAWQHGSIAQRVSFLRRLYDNPGLEPRFQRRLRILKWSVTLGLAGLIGILVGTGHWDWSKAIE